MAERPSSPMPGSSLLAKAIVASPLATLYTRIDDLFGWLWVAATAVFLSLNRRSVPSRMPVSAS